MRYVPSRVQNVLLPTRLIPDKVLRNTYCSFFKPNFYGSLDTGIVDDYGSAENELINGYDPGNLSGDINIDIDTDSWNAVFQIFNMFITGNSVVMTLIITMLSLGFIALILNR